MPLWFFVRGHGTPLCAEHLSSSLANAGVCYKLSIYVIGLWAPVSNLSGCASSAFFTTALLCMPFPVSLHDSAVCLDRSFVKSRFSKATRRRFVKAALFPERVPSLSEKTCWGMLIQPTNLELGWHAMAARSH